MSHSLKKPSIFYYANIKPFMDKFLIRGLNEYSIQRYYKNNKKWGYYPEDGKVTPNHFFNHFYNAGKDYGHYILGSLAFRPSINDQLKWVCFDIDNQDQKDEFKNKVIPNLERYGLGHIREHGSTIGSVDSLDRSKEWIPLNCSVDTARHLIHQIGEEVGLNFIDPQDKQSYFDEIFGVNKLNFVCRFPLGYHVSKHAIYPIEVNEELSYDPEDFIKQFLLLPQPTDDELKPLLKPLKKTIVVPEAKRIYTGVSEFRYVPRNLELPDPIKVEDLPPETVKPVRNCQALRDVLDGIIHDNYLMDKIKSTHPFGLAWAGLCAYNDVKLSKKTRKNVDSGKEFFRYLVNEYRDRDDEKHQWGAAWKTAEKQGHDRVFWSCKKLDETFGACTGCPWRGQIKSPKQFIYGKEVTKKMISDVKLSTPAEIRANTFPLVKDRIFQLLKDNCRSAILLKSVPNSGKSWAVSDWAVELSRQGYRVLIAVHDSNAAIEYRTRMRAEGANVFVALSHKSIFAKKEDLGFSFDCQYYSEIQEAIKLGVSSSTYKQDFCQNCPFLDKCYYPRQYSEVLEPEYPIVVIQHAHLGCQEVMYELVKKNFDVMFIDESFINSMYSSLKVFKYELDLLSKFDYRWTQKLVEWMQGEKRPNGVLSPPQNNLEAVHKAFGDKPYRVPDLIRYYNQGRVVNPYTGIEVIYELPSIPLYVFTDGTPPEDLIKLLTGIPNLEVWGDNEVLDVKRIHPDNEIIQVLDISSSRSFLEADDNLETILTKIGEIVDDEFKDKKVLVTVASYSMKEKVEQFFLDHRETFTTPIIVDIMKKGTNEYADFDCQFLLAGRYYKGIDYLRDVYKYKSITNHVRRKRGLVEINNIYPVDIPDDATIPLRFKLKPDGTREYGEPVERIEKIHNKGGVFRYDNFKNYPPLGYWRGLCYEYNRAETMQAVRIRFLPDKPRRVYILNNYNLSTILVTKSLLFDEFINS